MQQSTVTDYFKVKKRTRDDSTLLTNKAKVVATISSSGKDGPSPIRTAESSSPEEVGQNEISPAKFFSPSRQRDIFSSPVKLSEIHSPSPSKLAISLAGRATVKRLFDSTNSTDGSNESPSPKKIPAYQRFHHLAQKTGPELNTSSTSTAPVTPVKALQEAEVNSSTTPTAPRATEEPLHLPFKFKVLQELFQAVETVTSILYNRKELITFEKVRPAVQQLVRRITLKEKHLGQMLTVFPGCYNLCYEKLKVGGSYQEATSSNQLIIGINLSATSGMVGESDIMTPVIITERRRIFRCNLLKIAHGHHRTFLSSLIPPIVLPSGKLVTRWHPKFRLDEVPDIGTGGVPEKAAAAANERINTARDVIAKAQNIIANANPRMKKALQDLLKKTTEDKDKKNHNPSASASAGSGPSVATTSTVQLGNNKNTKKSYSALKGISQSLIEKIRAREHEKSIRAMTLTPEEIRQKTMVNRLPDFVKMLRNTMVAEKKSALPLNFVVERLCHSTHGALSPGDVEDHIRLLSSKLPIFATIIRSTQGEYVKINKDLDINDLLDSLKEIIRKYN